MFCCPKSDRNSGVVFYTVYNSILSVSGPHMGFEPGNYKSMTDHATASVRENPPSRDRINNLVKKMFCCFINDNKIIN